MTSIYQYILYWVIYTYVVLKIWSTMNSLWSNFPINFEMWSNSWFPRLQCLVRHFGWSMRVGVPWNYWKKKKKRPRRAHFPLRELRELREQRNIISFAFGCLGNISDIPDMMGKPLSIYTFTTSFLFIMSPIWNCNGHPRWYPCGKRCRENPQWGHARIPSRVPR